MDKVEIIYNQIDDAISVMKEVAQWGREKDFRVWLGEWLTPEELITEEAKPENFCVGKVDGKAACAFILQKNDSEYWKNSSEVQAVYLHKLSVRCTSGTRKKAKRRMKM